jgi:hypothetical protein
MRRSLLLLALTPLLLAPPALAKDAADAEASCPPPEITHHYATDVMAVHVKLPASGCASREHTMFQVAAFVGRFDDFGPRDSIERTVTCGPFTSADDRDPDEAPAQYFCELDVALPHPTVETMHYDIDVGYPGATSARNHTVILACTSDGEVAVCDTEQS